MTRLHYTERAEADLDQILAYIMEVAGPSAALALNDEIHQICETLRTLPRAASTRLPHLRSGLTRHSCGRYNLYFTYDASDDVLYLVRVLHSAREVSKGMFD